MMVKSFWQRTGLAAAGLALLVSLAGCAAAGTAAVTSPAAKAPAVKAPAGLHETAKAEDIAVTLDVQPLKIGENHLVVKVDKPEIKAAEAQIVMATMGHGQIVELRQTAPGTFEATTGAIDMDGRWMFRIEVTDGAGNSKTAVFHTVVKPQ